MRRLMTAAILAAGAAVAWSAPLAAASVRAGIEAWRNDDPGRAVTIWRGLAERGDQDAAFNLGQAYRLGRGVAADSSEARKWFERAAKAGHLDAQVSFGLLLFDIGDRSNALNWLRRAADRGEPRAMLVTGTALFNGDGMPRDEVRGYAYVSRAAAHGLAAAKTTLAEMDKAMPLSDRLKGVALALAATRPAAAAKPAATRNNAAVPKPTARTTPTAPAKPAIPARPVARVAALPVPKKAAPPVAVAASGGWRIQLGAFGTRGAAQALFGKLGGSLGGVQAYYVPVGAMTRLQAGPFASRAAATDACARLKPQPCFAVAAK